MYVYLFKELCQIKYLSSAHQVLLIIMPEYKRESVTDVISILRYFNFRHVSIRMKFISRQARRDRIIPRIQLRWHLHFHLLGNVVDVSLAYLHRGDEQCISRRSWFPIMFHEVGENWKSKGMTIPLR